MSKEKQNKVVGNSFEDISAEEMAKTQGAGDTEAEYIGFDSRRLSLPEGVLCFLSLNNYQ